MQTLRKATAKAHRKGNDAWDRTSWERQRKANFDVIDGQAMQHDGTEIQDGCGVCGVVKSECLKPEEHFGARGESPADAKCGQCVESYGNRFDSEHRLLLHVTKAHA